MLLSHGNLSPQEASRLRIAAIYLFGAHQAAREDFWARLSLEAVKQAFRQKAWLYHPDVQGLPESEAVRTKQDWFIKIKKSYDLLHNFLKAHQENFDPLPAGAPKIIAVGGAKGGIGKSMFAANLGVFLASAGRRPVAVDLDLGGANLHLYLGELSLPHTINDFLGKSVSSLTDLMVASRYGPRLIGGDSSQLGCANISFTSKMNLINALKHLDADHLIFDLGSGASFNVIDFFLAADAKIVLTTCDPSAYLEAYNFIKVGLFRLLNREVSRETSPSSSEKRSVKELVYEATMSPNGGKVKNVQELLQIVRREHPEYCGTLQNLLEAYQPGLLVNKVADETEADPVVRRIQEVARKMLGIRVKFLGALPYQEEICRSTRNLAPVLAGPAAEVLARRMDRIVQAL